MRIKLINPPNLSMRDERRLLDMPYGLGVLAAFLRKNNFLVDLADLNANLKDFRLPASYKRIGSKEISDFHQRQERAGCYEGIVDKKNNLLADELLELVDLKNCDLVGIGVNSLAQILTALLLAEKIKSAYKVPIVFGGSYVTLYAEMFFSKYNFIDYAIIGEGEMPLIELLHYMQGKVSIQKVPSLYYRSGKSIKFNRRIIYNAEDQTCPDFEGLPLELYGRSFISEGVILTIPYSTSRGCNGRCTFCTMSNVDGRWRYKSIEKVIRDITILKKKYKSSFFVFEDLILNESYEHLSNLCDRLIEEKLNIQWMARVKGSNLDEIIIAKMKKAGCHLLKWGIESGSNRILQLMNKNVDIKKQSLMLKMSRAAGIKNLIYLIIGYPYENISDLKETISFLRSHRKAIDLVDVYTLKVFRGSYIFSHANELKIKLRARKDSFFSYLYDYEEEDLILEKDKKHLKRLKQKIESYTY